MYIYIYQKQDIYFFTSYISVSFQPSKIRKKPKYNSLGNKYLYICIFLYMSYKVYRYIDNAISFLGK